MVALCAVPSCAVMEPWLCSTVALLLSVADPALGIKLPNVGAVVGVSVGVTPSAVTPALGVISAAPAFGIPVMGVHCSRLRDSWACL